MMGSTTSHKINSPNSNGIPRKQKDEFTVSGYIRQQSNNTLIFPAALIDLCFLFYHIKYEILKWSTEFKTEGLELTDDGRCIAEQSAETTKKLRGYKYALCDAIPIKFGKACWRFRINNPSRYWFSTAIAKPNIQYPNDGTSKHGVYGVGTDPNWYPYSFSSTNRWRNTNDKHSGNWSHPSKTHEIYHIDMLFDADIGEVQFCMLEDKKLNAKVWGVPLNTEDGYIPHFNTISLTKCKIRIASIPIESYGEEIEDMFTGV